MAQSVPNTGTMSRQMAQLARTSLPDQVFRRLVADVLSGRYAPGERLPAQRALAAARRSPEQAALLARLARELAAASGDEAAQGLDFAFMATTIEAAANLAFSLIANSIRDVYLQHLELFRAIVTGRDELDYAAVAGAIGAGEQAAARAAMATLAAAQERRLLEALG